MKSIAAACTLILSLSACATTIEGRGITAVRVVTDSKLKEPAAQTDPALRAWREGNRTCAYGDLGTQGFSNVWGNLETCLRANDDTLIGALNTQAKAERDAYAQSMLEKAAKCVASVPISRLDPEWSIAGRADQQVYACFEDKRRAIEAKRRAIEAKRADESAYAQLEQNDSAESWLAFIEKNRADKRVPTAAARVIELAGNLSGDAQFAIDQRLITVYPVVVDSLPASRRVLLIGPKGASVRDLRKLTDAKIAQSVILARVRASTQPYKNFDADELSALQQLGLADEIVAAMIEVTAKLEDRRHEDDERRALRVELEALKKLIEGQQAASGTGEVAGQIVQTKEGPMDVLASCGKRLAAVELCEHAPFPFSTLCSTAAEEEFPCPNI